MSGKTTLSQRSSGILLHPTSLPSPHGIGDLGPEAYRFVDYLAEAGQTWWQTFPIGPLGAGNSPYQTLSAFAGNHLLISLEKLVEDGLLSPDEIEPTSQLKSARVNYGAVYKFKLPLFKKAFQSFQSARKAGRFPDYDIFVSKNAFWLQAYAFFCAIKDKHKGAAWTEWEPEARLGKSSYLVRIQKTLAEDIQYHQFLQYLFHSQWMQLKKYCMDRHIGLIGDIPIFVSHDSSDVWSHPEIFWLGPDGRSTVVAGVPPDYFSKKGQLWGNPLYRWAVLRERSYDWWITRFKLTFEHFDAARLDHFIGFVRYWEVSAKSSTAESGRYVDGPGADFFKKVFDALGPLEIIAEDLGVVTPEVRVLRTQFNFPGLRVLQFAFGNDGDNHSFLPHNHVRRSVVYTGTHDNDTTVGWFRDKGTRTSTRTREQIERERKFAMSYMNCGAKDFHWSLIRLAMMSVSDTVLLPMQDILGLDSRSRMNLPGTVKGNWEWRMDKDALSDKNKSRLLDLTRIYCRLPPRK